MAAPQCLISPIAPVESAPAVAANAIPIATPTNLVQVANAIRNWILANSNQNTGGNNGSNNGGNKGGSVGEVMPPNPNPAATGFVQSKQVVKSIKIYDPNDPTGQTYVTVDQVVGLTMFDKTSGKTWTWSAPSSIPGTG